mgnify:CR=1 FL=1
MERASRGRWIAGACALALAAPCVHAGQPAADLPAAFAPSQQSPTQPSAATAPAIAFAPSTYVVRYDRWTPEDERGFGEFIAAIGQSNCRTIDQCFHGVGNPFHASDPAGIYFHSDCADFPYVLRAYYAWKRGLPFSYVAAVEPRGHSRDIRYTVNGNEPSAQRDVLTGSTSGYALLETLRDVISSATYRVHPDIETPYEQDLYSPRIAVNSIRPGTVIYDPNGHLATIYRVDPDGRISYIDAHPDNSVTRGFYDLRFVRSRPGMGAGFKNWRPMQLEGAMRRGDGAYIGGHVVLTANKDIADFSDEQYFGTGARPADSNWSSGGFVLNGEAMDYYDFVRATLAGGKLEFDPLKEVRDMAQSNCNDLQYRADAVNLSIAAGIQNRAEPERLPPNIYGTEGDWETYSTPSRDARLKTAFKELRDSVQRFVTMYRNHDAKLVYKGSDLVGDLLAIYDRQIALCHLSYTRSDGSQIALSYDDARKRLFAMSFDPYQCIERRWGASDAAELSTCRDGANKQAWYAAEQNLRNQIDRTYEAKMDYTLEELKTPGPGKGVAQPPDIDVRAYLVRMRGTVPAQASAATQAALTNAPRK